MVKTAKPRIVGGPNCPFIKGRPLELKSKSGRTLPPSDRSRDRASRCETAKPTPPEHKSEAKHRSALENEASPFAFRKKESALAGEKLCASIGANAQAETEKRRSRIDANQFSKTVEDPRNQTDRD